MKLRLNLFYLLSVPFLLLLLTFRPSGLSTTCHLISPNPDFPTRPSISTRSLCIHPPLCLTSNTLHLTPSTHQCTLSTASLTPLNTNFPTLQNATTCSSFVRNYVHCVHGRNLRRALPECPQIARYSQKVQRKATWLKEITIVVPDYAFPRNIYHFVNPLTDAARIIDHLPRLVNRRVSKVNLLFRMSRNILLEHPWKRELFDIMTKRRFTMSGIQVSVKHLDEFDGPLCLQEPILLGRRGDYDVWPFPNATEIPMKGGAIHREAVQFKRAVYEEYGLKVQLPSGKEGVINAPPLRVVYAKRNGTADIDGYYRGGRMRKFSLEDEQWFEEMLYNETQAAGIDLRTVTFSSSQGLREQVELIMDAGLLVGIHGANLVNGMFMKPLGAMVEILPNGVGNVCYWAGANSGLWYGSVELSERVGVTESGCFEKDFLCISDLRQRGVRIGGDGERIRATVKDAIKYVVGMERRFGEKVPVVLNEDSGYYDVVW